MTIEEIKKTYGDDFDNYVFCDKCPWNSDTRTCTHPEQGGLCDGYGIAYVRIKEYFDLHPDQDPTLTSAPVNPVNPVNPVKDTPITPDMVNHPPHYCREGGMESIDEMVLVFGKEAVKHFCLCNVWKYRYRSSSKNGDEDLKKSDWYMRKYKELCQ